MMGNAAVQAAGKLRDQLAIAAAESLETLPERVRPGDPDTTGTVRPSAPTPDPKTSDGVLRPQKG